MIDDRAIDTKEYEKFTKIGEGTSVNVNMVNGLFRGITWDNFTVEYPDAVTEIYRFTSSAVLVLSVQLIYTDSTKKNLLSGGKI